MGVLIFYGVMIGLAATAAMDLWAILLHRVLGLDLPNWAAVGRWFRHLGRGRVFHDEIAAAAPFAGERALGWVGHYAVGVAYGVIFVLIVGAPWLARPTLLPAWIFGMVTVGAGWFLLQPGMGLGWAASKTASPWKVRLLNLAAHTIFALGMWAMALVLVWSIP